MQERAARVFLVATANSVEELPPELMRKGRVDEIFFVDLPEPAARAEIFRLHLARRGEDASRFDLAGARRRVGGVLGRRDRAGRRRGALRGAGRRLPARHGRDPRLAPLDAAALGHPRRADRGAPALGGGALRPALTAAADRGESGRAPSGALGLSFPVDLEAVGRRRRATSARDLGAPAPRERPPGATGTPARAGPGGRAPRRRPTSTGIALCTTSCTPASRAAIVGTPWRIASSTVRPKGSVTDGST